MRRALYLARLGEGHVSPNPMVGCVITAPDGKIIGEGWHRQFGGPHAEVNAIDSVTDKNILKHATMYVTLEPCSHHGKTPPCADLIVRMGIPRVVIGSKDPFPEVSGRGIARLQEVGTEVHTGCLESECVELNRRFMTAHKTGRPYVTLKWAQDAAGNMGSTSGKRIFFSNTLSMAYVHRLRSCYDAIMVGKGTLLADNPKLDVRLWHGKNPRPVIFANTELDGKFNLTSNPECIKYSIPISLNEILRDLYKSKGVTSLLVEGGKKLLESFIADELWDEMRTETYPSLTEADLPAPHVAGYLLKSANTRGNTISILRRIEK